MLGYKDMTGHPVIVVVTVEIKVQAHAAPNEVMLMAIFILLACIIAPLNNE